jgi:hypothetical protein
MLFKSKWHQKQWDLLSDSRSIDRMNHETIRRYNLNALIPSGLVNGTLPLSHPAQFPLRKTVMSGAARKHSEKGYVNTGLIHVKSAKSRRSTDFALMARSLKNGRMSHIMSPISLDLSAVSCLTVIHPCRFHFMFQIAICEFENDVFQSSLNLKVFHCSQSTYSFN